MLETARLIVRPPLATDATELCAIRNSAFVMRYNPMKPMDEDELRCELEKNADSGKAFVIVDKLNGMVIGVIDLGDDSLRYRVSSLAVSYYLGEQYAGKGYMSEALHAVIDYAFDRLGIELLAARVFADNEASARLLLRCGMLHEATVRHCVRDNNDKVHDDKLFSLTRKEWQQLRT